VIDMATVSPQLPRKLIIHWDDPRALAETAQTMKRTRLSGRHASR
jgi:hypothetical protein